MEFENYSNEELQKLYNKLYLLYDDLVVEYYIMKGDVIGVSKFNYSTDELCEKVNQTRAEYERLHLHIVKNKRDILYLGKPKDNNFPFGPNFNENFFNQLSF